ncbi:MAG: hypothetical protein U0169_12595 [Polyangiaceae bacterium]
MGRSPFEGTRLAVEVEGLHELLRPAWVSDYNYGKLFTRMQAVNGVTGSSPSTLVASAAATASRSRAPTACSSHGRNPRVGSTLRLRKAPMGDTRRVVFRNRGRCGRRREPASHRYLHAEGDGASYYVDSPPADYETMSLEPGSAREGLRFVHRDTR